MPPEGHEAVRGHQFPAVAGELVVGVDAGRAPEAVAGELALDGGEHAVDAVVAPAVERGVDQMAVARPDLTDQGRRRAASGLAVLRLLSMVAVRSLMGFSSVGRPGGALRRGPLWGRRTRPGDYL